jgi:hypothetical protein
VTSRRVRRAALATLLLAAAAPRRAPAQAVGSEFRVNTYTSGDQDMPSAAMDGTGKFVVVWRAHGPAQATNGPRAQRYDAAGAPSGTEFTTSSAAYYFLNGGIAAAGNASGDFVVVWSDYAQDGSKLNVFGQRYDDAGAPLGQRFRVNTYTTGDQLFPRAAMDGNGNFVVAWLDSGEDGSGSGVYAQRYASTGAPLGGEFRVNTYTTSDQDHARVASDSSGNFVVVWRSKNQDGVFSVFGQRYASTGAPLGGEFRVSAHTDAYNGEPAVASAPGGGFVVVWKTTYGVPNEGVVARRYSAAGAPLASEFRVNTGTVGYMDWISIAALGSSGYLVSWEAGAGGGSEARGQRLSSIGSPIGAEFRVNTSATTRHYYVDVAANAQRKAVITWVTKGQDGGANEFGVFAQRYQFLANGDVNSDGHVDVADVFYLINALFAGGAAPTGPADVNGDGGVDVADVFYLINTLFAGGAAPV